MYLYILYSFILQCSLAKQEGGEKKNNYNAQEVVNISRL